MEVGARFSLKVIIKACFNSKKNSEIFDFLGTFVKQEGRSAVKKIEVPAVNLGSLYLFQLRIF